MPRRRTGPDGGDDGGIEVVVRREVLVLRILAFGGCRCGGSSATAGIGGRGVGKEIGSGGTGMVVGEGSTSGAGKEVLVLKAKS